LIPSSIKFFLINAGISYINSFLAFVTFLLLARLLGAVEYSKVAIAIAVGGFLIPILNLGSSKTFVRDAVKVNNISSVALLAQQTINMRITVTLSSVVMLLIGGAYIYNSNIEMILAFVFLSSWVGLLGLYPTSLFDFVHKTSLQNINVMIERLLVVLLVATLILLDGIIEGLVFISFALLIVRIFSIYSQLSMWWKWNSKINFKFNVKYPNINSSGVNLIFTLSMLSNALYIYGNQLILATTNDPIGLSSYSFAYQLIGLVFLFQVQAIRVLNRSISETCCYNLDKVLKLILIHSGLLIALSLVASGTVYFASQYLPEILNDSRYQGINEFLPYLCVWVVIAGFGQVIVQYLLEFRQEKFHLLISFLSGISAFILGLILVPIYGAMAVAIILLCIHSLAITLYCIRLIYVIHKKQDIENIIELA